MSEKENNSEMSNYEKTEVLEDEYIVEKILDRKKIAGIIKYKVKWEGYDVADCTWEPRENLENVIYLVEEFDDMIKQKEREKTKEKRFLNNKTNRNNSNISNNLDSSNNFKSKNNFQYDNDTFENINTNNNINQITGEKRIFDENENRGIF